MQGEVDQSRLGTTRLLWFARGMEELTEIEAQGVSQPNWLNYDYLFNINYGPASMADTVAASQLKTFRMERCERSRITLLDRRIADKLHFTLFNFGAARPCFCNGI